MSVQYYVFRRRTAILREPHQYLKRSELCYKLGVRWRGIPERNTPQHRDKIRNGPYTIDILMPLSIVQLPVE